jgi:hypothetical protein
MFEALGIVSLTIIILVGIYFGLAWKYNWTPFNKPPVVLPVVQEPQINYVYLPYEQTRYPYFSRDWRRGSNVGRPTRPGRSPRAGEYTDGQFIYSY